MSITLESMRGIGGPYSPNNAGNTTGILGGSGNNGTNYLGWADIGMQGLNAIGSILSANVAKKNYRLNKEAFQFNKEMQSATTLANIQNRIAQYKALDPNADVSHLAGLAQRLQSYLPQQNTTVVPRTAQPVQQQATPVQQPVGMPNTPTQSNGYDSMARYGRGG